jgi:GntR family phosphonate transport system transcriptional regulator/GntR family transcriptional regulator
VETSTLLARVLPQFEHYLTDFHSLYEILQSVYGFRPTRIRSTIHSTFCSSQDAKYLPEDEPVLLIESLMFHPDGFPVELARSRMRGGVNEIVIQFGADGNI